MTRSTHVAPILVHTVQEAAELTKAATKLAIYGVESRDSKTGRLYDNQFDLDMEAGDLLAALERAMELGAIDRQSVEERRDEKLALFREIYQ